MRKGHKSGLVCELCGAKERFIDGIHTTTSQAGKLCHTLWSVAAPVPTLSVLSLEGETF